MLHVLIFWRGREVVVVLQQSLLPSCCMFLHAQPILLPSCFRLIGPYHPQIWCFCSSLRAIFTLPAAATAACYGWPHLFFAWSYQVIAWCSSGLV
jgi:hypothetical protein